MAADSSQGSSPVLSPERAAWPWFSPWLAALFFLTVFRLVAAALIPVTPDEAYYWTWSRALQPGYLDHPPMVALCIRLGTVLFGSTALGIRLLSPLGVGAGTLLIAQAARDFTPRGTDHTATRGHMIRAGAFLNATLALGIGGALMTPDTPLLFFVAVFLWALGRLIATGRAGWWLVIGLAIGLGFDSKYTMVLPAGGLTLWLFATASGRAHLKTPWPWLAAVLAVLLLSPVIAWNAAHGWASFAKQGGRTGDWRPARAMQFLGELLGGQIGLATPGIFVFFVGGVWMALRARAAEIRVLGWIVLVPMLVFLQHALGDRVQANWPVLVYPAAAIAASFLPWRGWRACCGFGLALSVIVVSQAAVSPLRLSPHVDVTLRQSGGWAAFAQDVAARPEAGFIISDEYGLASELALRLLDRVVLGADSRWGFFRFPRAACTQGQGLLVVSTRRAGGADRSVFPDAVLVGTLARARKGVTAETYRLYRVTCSGGWKPGIVQLPGAR